MSTLYLGLQDRSEGEEAARAAAAAGFSLQDWSPGHPLPEEDGAVFLLDTRLSGDNAYELARQGADRGSCRIILLGGREDRPAARALARFAKADYLARPLRAAALIDLLKVGARGFARPDLAGLVKQMDEKVPGDWLASSLLLDLEARSGDEQGGGFLQGLTDGETGLFNRPFMAFRLDEEVKRARRFNQPLTLVLLQVHIHTHEAGPPVDLLLTLSGRLLTEARDIDALGRWGESGLMLLLPGTPAGGARIMLERVFASLPDLLVDRKDTSIAAGFAATREEKGENRSRLLARAEEALDRADRQVGEGDCFTALVEAGE